MLRTWKGSVGGLTLAAATIAAPLLLPLHAVAAAPPVTTTVSAVRSVSAPSGTAALYSFVAQQDASGTTGGAGTLLPGAQIPRSAINAGDGGAWHDAGALGAWMSPGGSFGFNTALSTVENGYFIDDISPTDGQAMHAGDSTQLAMAGVRYDNPLPWDRARGAATKGALTWELTEDFRHISGSFGGSSGSADAVLFRADLFAAGGDIDARGSAMNTPVLSIPLPQHYPTVTSAPSIAAEFLPTTEYLSQLSMHVSPQGGTALLSGSVRGYLPQADTLTLPSGAVIREWHLSLTGVIVIPASTAGPAPVLQVRGTRGGVALVQTGAAPQTVTLDGDGIEVTPGLAPRLLDAPPAHAGAHAQPPSPPGGSTATQELRAADAVNHTLSAPTSLTLGDGYYATSIDPNTQRSGTLAVNALTRASDGVTYESSAGVPYALINGITTPLTRDRLTDLRATPVDTAFAIGFTGLAGTTSPSTVLSVFGVVASPGMLVTAVYDLGGSVYDFVSFEALAPPLASGDGVTVISEVLSLSASPVTAYNVQYETVPEGAPLDDGAVLHSTEFSEPFDAGTGAILTAGAHTIEASIAQANASGVLTVKAGTAQITASPVADPSVSLGVGPFTMYYMAPSGLPPRDGTYSLVNVALRPPAATASPPPLGQACGASQMTEGDSAPTADAPPELDIVQAWFDSDAADVYATLQLHNVPTAAPAQTQYQWSVNWRAEHAGEYARATLDSGGAWTFDIGSTSSMTGALGTIQAATGDVQPGSDGFIRITVPRTLFGYRDGTVLRDTAAQSWVAVSGVSKLVDAAPEGAATGWGSGSDYVVGTCGLGTALPEMAAAPGAVTAATAAAGVLTWRRRRRRSRLFRE